MKILQASVFVLSVLLTACSSKDTVAPIAPPAGNEYKDVVYGSNTDWQGNTVSLNLDVYQPTDLVAGKKYPLVINIHGGGYVSGDKASSAEKCRILADSGFIAVSINYRLGWESNDAQSCTGDTASFNDAIYRAMQDANAAIRFLVSKADVYKIDTDWIFISGASAGAGVALTAAYIDDNYARVRYPKSAAKLGALQTASNSISLAYTIKGICSIAGALPDSTLINSGKAFPTIFFQGQDDEVVPVNFGKYLACPTYELLYGTLPLYRQLISYNKSAVAHILPGAGHGNNGDGGYDNSFMMDNTACFFHTLMKKPSQQKGIYIGTVNSCNN